LEDQTHYSKMGFSLAGPLVTEEGVANLLKYKYHGGGYTWLDTVMNPMWIAGAARVPRWVRLFMYKFHAGRRRRQGAKNRWVS
jgi:hypothetical protein